MERWETGRHAQHEIRSTGIDLTLLVLCSRDLKSRYVTRRQHAKQKEDPRWRFMESASHLWSYSAFAFELLAEDLINE